MGTWGAEILSDDLAADVHSDFLARYDAGETVAAITRALHRTYAEPRSDLDEGPVFWLALAQAQWECGALDPAVLAEVEDIVAGGRGLDRRREAGPAHLRPRERALEAFLARIRIPAEAPRARQGGRLRDAVYAAGDCLSLRLDDGAFGAAVVLAARRSKEGDNLIGVLRYHAPSAPEPGVFERRDWLHLTHHLWKGNASLYWIAAQGHGLYAESLQVVGSTALREEDPSDTGSYALWDSLFTDVEEQFAWEATHDRPSP